MRFEIKVAVIDESKHFNPAKPFNIEQNGLFWNASLTDIDLPPAYDRGAVLREEWRACSGIANYYAISNENVIFPAYPYGCNTGFALAPNYELAQEIVSIREGKWLPKDGDFAFWCKRDNFDARPYYFSTFVTDVLRCPNVNYYFPSTKQRDTFIEKNKPKEEKQISADDLIKFVERYTGKKRKPFTAEEMAELRSAIDKRDEESKFVGYIFMSATGREEKVYADENGVLKIKK